jgi:hypothetical protein
VHKCDLCNEVRDCAPKFIGDKEYDVCVECWKALGEKLKGKGKEIRIVEPLILLPDPREFEAEGRRPTRTISWRASRVIWAGNGLTP